jgi:predicted nucleic acid-binding protein
MSTLVIDASVAVKWLIAEMHSNVARALADAGTDLIAPDLILAEVANALWRSVRMGRLTSSAAARAVDVLPPAFSRLVSAEPLLRRAFALAASIDHPVYDCLYLALAEREAADLVTADARLIALGRTLPGLRVRSLVP